jgi:hypothetical protein
LHRQSRAVPAHAENNHRSILPTGADMKWDEELDILHAIENSYPYDGLFPQDWVMLLFKDSDLFNDVPEDLQLEMILYLAQDKRFRELILAQLNGFL